MRPLVRVPGGSGNLAQPTGGRCPACSELCFPVCLWFQQRCLPSASLPSGGFRGVRPNSHPRAGFSPDQPPVWRPRPLPAGARKGWSPGASRLFQDRPAAREAPADAVINVPFTLLSFLVPSRTSTAWQGMLSGDIHHARTHPNLLLGVGAGGRGKDSSCQQKREPDRYFSFI